MTHVRRVGEVREASKSKVASESTVHFPNYVFYHTLLFTDNNKHSININLNSLKSHITKKEKKKQNKNINIYCID